MICIPYYEYNLNNSRIKYSLNTTILTYRVCLNRHLDDGAFWWCQVVTDAPESILQSGPGHKLTQLFWCWQCCKLLIQLTLEKESIITLKHFLQIPKVHLFTHTVLNLKNPGPCPFRKWGKTLIQFYIMYSILIFVSKFNIMCRKALFQ